MCASVRVYKLTTTRSENASLALIGFMVQCAEGMPSGILSGS